jgi:hypothetical protein
MMKKCYLLYISAALRQALIAMLLVIALMQASAVANAGDRLLATGGVMQIEGAAGGGLTPWALISGYATREQIGGTAFYTQAKTTSNFDMNLGGVSVGFNNRVEISYAQQHFGLSDTVRGETIRMHTLGAKVRLFGDAIYDQDSWLPQLAAGVQYKKNEDYDFVPKALGAEKSSGIDYYISATKLYLAAFAGRNLLLNVTLQATKANQFGLLGFGGDKSDSYKLQPAASAAIMLTDNLLLGAEYRARPDNLSVFKEDDAHDIFLAWFPSRNLGITAAYVDLGNIADKDNQRAWYLSGQISY